MRRFNLWTLAEDIIGLALLFGIVYFVLSL